MKRLINKLCTLYNENKDIEWSESELSMGRNTLEGIIESHFELLYDYYRIRLTPDEREQVMNYPLDYIYVGDKLVGEPYTARALFDMAIQEVVFNKCCENLCIKNERN